MTNKSFMLNATDPTVAIIPEETHSDIAIVCTALVKEVGKPLSEFAAKIWLYRKKVIA